MPSIFSLGAEDELALLELLLALLEDCLLEELLALLEDVLAFDDGLSSEELSSKEESSIKEESGSLDGSLLVGSELLQAVTHRAASIKGNKKILVIAVLLLLIAVSYGTYAIYRTSLSGNATVTAAKWDIEFKDGTTAITNLNVTFTSADCHDNAHVADGVIAPGASCTKNITVNAKDIEVDETNDSKDETDNKLEETDINENTIIKEKNEEVREITKKKPKKKK